MGLFEFARDAGEKLRGAVVDLFDGDDNKAHAAEKEIKEEIEKHQLPVDDLNIKLEKGRAILQGRAASQEAREKAILIAGNTYGVGQVDDQMYGPEPPSNAWKFYTVQSGDTLSKIAKEFYGDASKYPVIFDANKPMLKDPDKIYPGQALRIPPIL